MTFQKPSGDAQTVDVRCRQCRACRLDKARDWTVRCVLEATQHQANSFITLTYADLPLAESLNLHDPRNFLKRLRSRLNAKNRNRIRFFLCGEYGDNLGRPHYHALLFGYEPPDGRVHARNKFGQPIMVSDELTDIWGYGHTTYGSVTKESAGYCARYTLKKVTGKGRAEHYGYLPGGKLPEFTRQSLKPGLAQNWFTKYWRDCYPKDFITISGKKYPIPEYFDRLMEVGTPEQQKMVREAKIERAKFAANHAEQQQIERLRDKEKFLHNRTDQFSRNLH